MTMEHSNWKGCIIIDDPVPTPKNVKPFTNWYDIVKRLRGKGKHKVIIRSTPHQEDEIHKFIETREEKDDKKTNA